MTKFFGIYDSFAEAFPSIKSLVVLVGIDGHGARGQSEPHCYDESNLPEIVDCPDPNCGGGFQTSVVLKAVVDSKATYEKGSAVCSGQRGGAPLGVCVTQFNYCIDVVYKAIQGGE